MNKYDNISRYIIGILLVLYIGSIAVFNIILPDKTFSELENRMLEQTPRFSLKHLINGKFTSNYEKYISDQFAFRDFWIGVKSESERSIGKKENNGVYLGKDGFLIEKFTPDIKRVKKNISSINSFAASTPNLNKYFMLVPNSVSILKDKLPVYADDENQLVYIDKVKKTLSNNIKFVDVYSTLYSKKDEYIFYKTDHHWTTKGAYYTYTKLIEEMGFIPHDEEDYEVKNITNSFYGSLYSKSGFRQINPDSIQLYIPKVDEEYNVKYYDKNEISNSFYNMDNINKKDKYTVFSGGNHSLIKIKTNVNNKKKLVVVKDSYANCFIPFLTGYYSEIYVVDLRYYTDDLSILIKSNEINDMLILYNVNFFCKDASINNIYK
ncbi:DHHW family protein [Clostridium aestuarii]|uniref:DHHW family protein n=1 Tax=Clostridium aestuarii TaxID=338193 RepID=A0ABT4CYS4_9CLOT|nr:DHHW family protein [Clostridium aestuarii]MCY6484119.1 DHHW family protein [Clostridium aestuarii]